MRTWSASLRWVVIRLCPGLRRSRWIWTSASLSGMRGGQASTPPPPPTADPCDSPKVVMRNSRPKSLPIAAAYHLAFLLGRDYVSRPDSPSETARLGGPMKGYKPEDVRVV